MKRRNEIALDPIRGVFADQKTGKLGAFVPNGQIFIPGGPVTIGPVKSGPKATLHWEVHWSGVTHKTPTRAMFDSFIQLWQEPDSAQKIQHFAERWGPLAVQGDGTHLDAGKLNRVDRDVSFGLDSLEAWRYFSRRAYAVLKIAAELQRGGRGDECEWAGLSSPQKAGAEKVCPQAPFGFPNWSRRELLRGARMEYGEELSPERLKGVIAGEISEWLKRFGVSLQVIWAPQSRWQLEVSFSGWLLSAVALQLSLAVVHADGLYVCSACDKLYTRLGKRPNAGEKNYCPKCGRATAMANANRRQQQKRADARRLHRIEGKSAAEIAKLLGVRKVETVRGWIAKGKRDV
jgi:hypothetical protein